MTNDALIGWETEIVIHWGQSIHSAFGFGNQVALELTWGLRWLSWVSLNCAISNYHTTHRQKWGKLQVYWRLVLTSQMTTCQNRQLDIQWAIIGASVDAFHKNVCQQTQRVKIALSNENQWGILYKTHVIHILITQLAIDIAVNKIDKKRDRYHFSHACVSTIGSRNVLWHHQQWNMTLKEICKQSERDKESICEDYLVIIARKYRVRYKLMYVLVHRTVYSRNYFGVLPALLWDMGHKHQ